MSQTHLTLFAIVTFFAFSVINLASSDEAAAPSRYKDKEPTTSDPIIDNIAVSIAEDLLTSPVLGKYANFKVPHKKVHDLFFRVGSTFLGAADLYDPKLVEVAAEAGKEVGLVSSHLYFYSVGYMLAKFFQVTGVLTRDNADYLALRSVSAIELVACSNGVFDTESAMDACAYGIFNVLAKYGLATYDKMAKVFYIFATEIKRLAHKY